MVKIKWVNIHEHCYILLLFLLSEDKEEYKSEWVTDLNRRGSVESCIHGLDTWDVDLLKGHVLKKGSHVREEVLVVMDKQKLSGEIRPVYQGITAEIGYAPSHFT